jgi:hypothetical protein
MLFMAVAVVVFSYWLYGMVQSPMSKPLVFLRPEKAKGILYLALCLGFVGLLLWAEGTKPH